ncbi:MAG TPA: 30S ribosomal protein S5 [Spirochaetia bacterium]|nr:30S ribosomal protein S5 [Spirochaetia bacterium]
MQSGKKPSEKNSLYEEKLVKLNRVAKVVKGGRRFSFAALMVVGDKKGHVGIGYGKAKEVPDAIRKGIEDAKKNLVKINLKGKTIPHEVKAKFCKSIVWMKPASEGTGIIAGRAVRPLVEFAGIQNILTKAHGSHNTINTLKAALDCLRKLKNIRILAENRALLPEKIFE